MAQGPQPGDDYRPGLEGVVAVETAISFLDVEQESIVIRGYDLMELARSRSYPEVAYLILYGRLPGPREREDFDRRLAQHYGVSPAVRRVMEALPPTLHGMDALRTALSAMAADDAALADLSPEANLERAVALLGAIPTVVANSFRLKAGLGWREPDPALGYVANFLQLIRGRAADSLEIRAFDQLLTAYSEHEMPNSTFAARVIASTLSDMYGALVGAVASLKGPLHGGANEAVMRMLLEVGQPERMEPYLMERLARRERIMGFGHRVYMHRPDPRALLMKELLRELVAAKGQAELYTLCDIGEAVMRREKGLYPNLDYYAAPVYYLLDIPIELYTPIFFAARTAGLAAHVIEQQAHNRLFRPRVRYLGPRGLHA
ncbi:MAG: citrate synthase [Firmicutes bacterium]|nr:citrate synthase [Alicyclobacillaceae bacterium]MCL6497636.1 citrate synthase [Bacillota bacterium]